MAVVSAGDHLLVSDSAYRPTRIFCDGVLKRFGVEVDVLRSPLGAGIADLMRDNTKAVLVEAPGSQSFEMQDVPAIAEVVHARGAAVIMDNTWATPLLFPPHARGVDIAVEAGTKYLSGGSDLLLGLTSANARYWPALHRTFEHFAMCAGPGGRVPGPARPAHHGAAPARARGAGPRHGALAAGPAGGGPRAPPRPARRPRPRDLDAATSPAPPACSASS